MRRAVLVLVCVCMAALTACDKPQTADNPAEPITLFPPKADVQTTIAPARVTTTASAKETAARHIANDSYGETHTLSDAQEVTDDSLQFRTEDSYRFESAAVERAREQFREEVPLPDTLEITNIHVSDCTDDGKSVYYAVSMDGNYALQSGERVERSVLYDLGVNKRSGEVFDAQMQAIEVMQAYSLFVPKDTALSAADGEADDALNALVPKLLKDAGKTKVLSVQAVDGRPDVYTVLAEGVNDYGISIRETRDVELLRQDDGFTLQTAAETF